MRVCQFLDLVPKSVKTGAFTIVGCALLVGVAVSVGGMNHGRISAHGASLPVLACIAARGFCFGLLAGVLIATWAICLGYVYADARRRVMPPVLWTLVAALIPNLLGFLLYFASRRPIALPCTALRASDYAGSTIIFVVWSSRIVKRVPPGLFAGQVWRQSGDTMFFSCSRLVLGCTHRRQDPWTNHIPIIFCRSAWVSGLQKCC